MYHRPPFAAQAGADESVSDLLRSSSLSPPLSAPPVVPDGASGQQPSTRPAAELPRRRESDGQISGIPARVQIAREGSGSGTGSMTKETKADSIIAHFYMKTCAVITQARMANLASTSLQDAGGARASTSRPRHGSEAGAARPVNKWFNLELEETDLFRTELKTWRSVSSLISFPPSPASSMGGPSGSSPLPSPSVPPMILEVLLDTSNLTPNQVLVLNERGGGRKRVESHAHRGGMAADPSGMRSPRVQRSRVVLERWRVDLHPLVASGGAPELPAVYKQAIILFRALFTIVRTLPAWNLHKKLARRRSEVLGPGLQLGVRMSMDDRPAGAAAEDDFEGEVGLGNALGGNVREEVETFQFAPVVTPIGSLHVQCTYRINTDFAVEDNETLLSSRFIDEDFFRPTLKMKQREGATDQARPGSLPSRHAASLASDARPVSAKSRTSYGSLSSRHHLTVPSSPLNVPPPRVDPARIALPNTQPGSPLTGVPSSPQNVPLPSSSSKLGPTTTPGVEPAFVSISRAYSGKPASPQSPSPSNSGARRPSLTGASPSSGSPIFKSGSYVGSTPLSSSPSAGPTSNINRFPPPANPGFLPSSLRNSNSGGYSPTGRSPLVVGFTPTPGGSTSSPRPIPNASGSYVSYTGRQYSRSYGQGSSGSQSGEGSGQSPAWGGPESMGRRSRLSMGSFKGSGTFEASYHQRGPSSLGTSADRKKFKPDAEDDSDDIRNFLGMLESKPDLQASAIGASAVLSKSQADETLKKLAGSVYAPGDALADQQWRMSSLRRRTSRLSIEEEPHFEPRNPSPGSSNSQTYGSLGRPRHPSFAKRAVIPQRAISETRPTPSGSYSPREQSYFPTAASGGESPSASGSFRQYVPRQHRALGQADAMQSSGQSSRASSSRAETTAAPMSIGKRPGSIASVDSVSIDGDGDDGGISSSSNLPLSSSGQLAEEEAVGHLELSECGEPAPYQYASEAEVLTEERGRRWPGMPWPSPAGEGGRPESRDKTPAAVRHTYRRRVHGSHSRSPPEMPWLG